MSGRLVRRALEWGVPLALTGWFVVSVLAQHPDRSYDKVRKLDRTGSGIFIPNWRFFAPNPAVEDRHFLYRLANEDKTQHTPWRQAYTIAPRRLIHAVWFPGRRIEKAIFDVAHTLVSPSVGASDAHREAKRAAEKLILEFIRRRLNPEPGYPWFQVMMVRYSGFDHSEDPKYDFMLDYERV